MNYGLKSTDYLTEKLNPDQTPQGRGGDTQFETPYDRPSVSRMLSPEFYNRPVNSWSSELCEGLFKIKIRGSTIKAEVYYGLIHYISCFYCLAVIPTLMSDVGYDGGSLFQATALCSGIGCIVGGIVVFFCD